MNSFAEIAFSMSQVIAKIWESISSFVKYEAKESGSKRYILEELTLILCGSQPKVANKFTIEQSIKEAEVFKAIVIKLNEVLKNLATQKNIVTPELERVASIIESFAKSF